MTPRLLLDGLAFAECPRWHDGKLWFSDIFAHKVMTVDSSGSAATVVQLDERDLPAGLGFLPDGRLLIANLARPVILRVDTDGAVRVHSDLSDIAVGPLNDMVVDGLGRAYVGASGVDALDAPRPLRGTGSIIRVDPDGDAQIVAPEMDAPNGPVITPDGKQYIVASLPAAELTAFDIDAAGALSGRRVWADLQPSSADGIAIDKQSGVWTCSPRDQQIRRILEGGEVTDTIAVADRMPVAACLGGDDGHTLFILSVTSGERSIRDMTCVSEIQTIRVAVGAW